MNAIFSLNKAVKVVAMAAVTIMILTLFPISVSAAEGLSVSCASGTDFGTLTVGYTQPAAKTVTIKNTGDAALTNVQITDITPDYDHYFSVSPAGFNEPSLPDGDSCELTVQPRADLPEGDYELTIEIGAEELSPAEYKSITFAFKVKAPVFEVLNASIHFISQPIEPGTSRMINTYIVITPDTPDGLTYRVSGLLGTPVDPGTSISADRLLTAGAGEKNIFLSVTAASVYDPDVSDTALFLTAIDAGNLGRISTDNDLAMAFPAH